MNNIFEILFFSNPKEDDSLKISKSSKLLIYNATPNTLLSLYKELIMKLLGNNPLLEPLSDLFYSVQQERSRLLQVGKKMF